MLVTRVRKHQTTTTKYVFCSGLVKHMTGTDPTKNPIAMIGAGDLTIEARRRNSTIEFLSIPKGSEVPNGWKIHRDFKTKTRLVREKSVGAQLRDKVWLLFYRMGIPRISASDVILELKGSAGIEPFQPAVIAQDDEIIFVVVTAEQELPARKKRMSLVVSEMAQKKSLITTAVKKVLEVPQAKVVFLIATENIEWQDTDRKTAQDLGILIWDEYDIMALEELAEIAGEGARFQIYNRIFFGKKIRAFEVRVPALKAKMGGKSYYCMTLTPEHLLKIAYVHQRSASSTFIDISETYQRVLDSRRVQEIRRYIEEGGFFPNSVIINFTRPLWKEERIGSLRQLSEVDFTEPVMVTLPPYFGSAWIIDGQHRIYGYADSELKGSETVPVVAFVEESPEAQARIFLDINEKQKAIRSDLRWDLYEDIYLEATEPREQTLYAVSMIAKRLDKLQPFNGSVKIPTKGDKGHISLTTLCRVIKSERFIDPQEGPLFQGRTIESIESAMHRIAAFFQVIADQMPVQWRAGEKHYVHTNAGIVVLLGLLRDILDAIDPREINDIERFKQSVTIYLAPVIKHLREAKPEKLQKYRAAAGAVGPSRQIQAVLASLIVSANVGFKSQFLIKYEEEQKERERARRISLDEDKVVILLSSENEMLEIKGSLYLDIDRWFLGDGRKEKANKVMEEVLSSIVGFLNGKRQKGQLVIGAIETQRCRQDKIEEVIGACPQHGPYTVIGIENDYNFRERDQYELQIRDLVKDHITPDVESSIDMEWIQEEERTLVIITTTRDPNRWCYLDNERFYVRIGNRTRLLTGREMDDYKRQWAGKTE